MTGTYCSLLRAVGVVATLVASTWSVICALLRGRDRVLRAVRCGEAGRALQRFRHVTFNEEDGLAVVVDVEQLRRQGVAAVVPLAFAGVEVDPHAPTIDRLRFGRFRIEQGGTDAHRRCR